MKKAITIVALGAAVALYGCDSSTPGGPGTAAPESEKPMFGEADNTFTLNVPAMATPVEPGGQVTASIGIERGANFAQDVTLKFDDVPQGVHIEPDSPVIAGTDEAVELTIHAAEDAAVGDFTVKTTGHPETGADAMAEWRISIGMIDVDPIPGYGVGTEPIGSVPAPGAPDAAQTERDELIAQMRAELDALQVKYEELKARAAEASEDAKAELDETLAAAQAKIDEAEAALAEAKDAAPDRWEKIKEGFKGAADELKSMFE